MRIAFPVDGEKGLDSHIFEHFGHAPYFLVVDVSDGKITDFIVVRNMYEEDHGPEVAPRPLAEHNVDILICRGMDRKAIEYFDSLGIKVIKGAYECVNDIINMYLEGLLESTDYKPREKWGSNEGS